VPPQGPMLPRKATAVRRSRELLGVAAFQIGVLVAVERNRCRRHLCVPPVN
jgi:hypothetical protein